jgi:phosphopantothenoylcysteine decarboxylase / phosphopantothenate---cysteine ligase
MNLEGKKIILCITGSIAAYKTPELVRQMIKAGAEVKVICTEAAAKFVSPLALSTVSKNEVLCNISDGDSWNNHVMMGRWADLLLIAPCSANTLAKLANGICDNLVNAVYLSAICPVIIAPAMDEDMWHHPSTRRNIECVKSFGNHIIPVVNGELASGLTGEGRMAEPVDIVSYLSDFLQQQSHLPLKGKKALVSAGPTYEKIDPVRFIGNFSTGKMGIALAEKLAKLGAAVTLVLGPTHLRSQNTHIKTILVESAEEMFNSCIKVFPEMDIAIMAAAVADYKPKDQALQKIKKSDETLEISLTRNKDILAHLGSVKNGKQLLVGFALETENEMDNAMQKLNSKNADFIVLNSMQEAGAGFGGDTNKVCILGKDGIRKEIPLQSKTAVAEAIVDYIL